MVAYYYGKEDGINGDFNLSYRQLRIIDDALCTFKQDLMHWTDDRYSDSIREHSWKEVYAIEELQRKIEHYANVLFQDNEE